MIKKGMWYVKYYNKSYRMRQDFTCHFREFDNEREAIDFKKGCSRHRDDIGNIIKTFEPTAAQIKDLRTYLAYKNVWED